MANHVSAPQTIHTSAISDKLQKTKQEFKTKRELKTKHEEYTKHKKWTKHKKLNKIVKYRESKQNGQTQGKGKARRMDNA